jgi:hypothetical protein
VATAKKENTGDKAIEAATAQDALEEATKVGYLGTRVDPFDDSEHSLESGPDSPSAADHRAAAAKAEADSE